MREFIYLVCMYYYVMLCLLQQWKKQIAENYEILKHEQVGMTKSLLVCGIFHIVTVLSWRESIHNYGLINHRLLFILLHCPGSGTTMVCVSELKMQSQMISNMLWPVLLTFGCCISLHMVIH